MCEETTAKVNCQCVVAEEKRILPSLDQSDKIKQEFHSKMNALREEHSLEVVNE